MINKNFITDTDQIIEACQQQQLQFLHGNILIAKVKTDRITPGGIVLTDKTQHLEDYNSGFARIIALDSDYEGPLMVGDYILFPHDSRYKPKIESLREILKLEVIDDFLYTIQDNNVMIQIKKEVLHGDA